MKHISCSRCGRTVVDGSGEAKPYGLCRVCLELGLYKARRERERRTARWIYQAHQGILNDEGGWEPLK